MWGIAKLKFNRLWHCAPPPKKKNPICFTTKAEKKDIPIKLSKTNQLSYSYKSTSLDTNYHPKHADFY